MIKLTSIINKVKASILIENLAEIENGQSEFDYKYFTGQISALLETIDTSERELIGAIEEATYEENSQQQRNNIQRYFEGARKQLHGVSKLLKRSQQRGDF